MKTEISLGGKLSGYVLRLSDLFVALFLVGIFILTSCAKEDQIEPVIPPTNLKADVKVDKDTILPNEKVTFTLTSENAQSCVVTLNGAEEIAQPVNGKKEFTLTQSTFFEWTFYSDSTKLKSSDTKTFTFMIFVSDDIKPMPTLTLTSTPSRVEIGGSVTINIVATNYISVTSSDIPGVNGPGSYEVTNLTETTTFHAQAVGEGGTVSKTITITVDPPVGPDSTALLKLDRWYVDTVWTRASENDLWEILRVGSNGEWTVYTADNNMNGKIYYYRHPGVTPFGDGIWSWSSDFKYILHGSNDFDKEKVNKLDSSNLVLENKAICLGCSVPYVFHKTRYSHQESM